MNEPLDENEPDAGTVVLELHRDLQRKYRLHGSKVETLWRSFDQGQRTRAMEAGAVPGSLLKHRDDASLGVVCKLAPEWNLRDVTEPGSDYFLRLLRYRATTTLLDQYRGDHPLNSSGGDYTHITHMIRTRNLRHINESRLRNSFTLFLDEDEKYGQSYDVAPGIDPRLVLGGMGDAFKAGAAVPRTTGDFILMRQSCLLQVLNIIIEDILDIGSTTRSQKTAPNKDTDAAIAAMGKLSIQVQARPTKLSLSELLDAANDQRGSLNEYLDILSTEPVVLTHAVNMAFFTRPELVADEKGRCLPVHTDRYISAATFEAVFSAVKAAAIWTYLYRLLQLLQSSTDKTHRAILLQEISNTCHLEYSRTQSLLKRYLQSGAGSGAKYFKRVSNVYDSGHARVSMKIKPEELTRADPQLHYLLRLCQSDTNPTKAVEWMDKLWKLHTAHSEEREKLSSNEFEALCDHAVIIAFMQDLAPGISMPPLSRKKGQLFVSRSRELETELMQIRDEIDLTEYVVPIDNLTEPGVAHSALEALDEAISGKMGSKLGFLYEDLIDDCLADLEKQYQQFKAKAEPKGFIPFPTEVPQPAEHEHRVEQRRQKEKTRPAHSSVFQITAAVGQQASPKGGQEPPAPPAPKFKVKAATAEVFSTLFAKSEARGTVSWAAYEAAMADLGFAVIPKFGSVYTFVPPDSLLGAKKSLTIHRPHKSHIEGWLLPVFARRMKRVYGWDQDTFETE